MALPVLKGKRIILRQVRIADADDVYEYAKDREVSKWIPAMPHPYTREDAVAYIREVASSFRKKGDYMYNIEYRETRRIVGGISLHNFRPASRSCEFGYCLHRKYWRQGLTSEAIQLLMPFAFRELKQHRVAAWVIGPNQPSANLLLKLGFRHEGTAVRAAKIRGRYYDALWFAMLAEEFAATPWR